MRGYATAAEVHSLVQIVLLVAVSVLSGSSCLCLSESLSTPVIQDCTGNSRMSNPCTNHCNDQLLEGGHHLRCQESARRIELLDGC